MRVVEVICEHLPAGELELDRAAVSQFNNLKNLAPLDLMLANLEFLKSCRVDGEEALIGDHIRRTACHAGVKLLAEEDTDAVAALRRLDQFATERGLNDVNVFCNEVLQQWRTPQDSRLERIKTTMRLWNELPIPELPQVRLTRVSVGK